MSKFPKSARHPDFLTQVENWILLGDSINVENDLKLSDLLPSDVANKDVETIRDIEYRQAAREIVGANAIRTLAKSYEALDALARCGNRNVNMAALLQCYNASFFAARGFCMLMGFSPLNRNSAITLDTCPRDLTKNCKRGEVSDVLRLHKYTRWSHEAVWKLTRRLIDTISVPEALKDTKKWLREANLRKSAKFRNAFQYDDSQLAPICEVAYVDFPDVAEFSFFSKQAPADLIHQFLVTKNLMKICSQILHQASIQHLLFKCVSERRYSLRSVTVMETLENKAE